MFMKTWRCDDLECVRLIGPTWFFETGSLSERPFEGAVEPVPGRFCPPITNLGILTSKFCRNLAAAEPASQASFREWIHVSTPWMGTGGQRVQSARPRNVIMFYKNEP
jgi:hypothetical protein